MLATDLTSHFARLEGTLKLEIPEQRVGDPVAPERPDEGVLEKPPPDVTAGLEPARRFDQPEEACTVALVIQGEALDNELALVHAVLPVRVQPVTGADHQVH